MKLAALVAAPFGNHGQIAEYLDGLDHSARVAQTRSLGRAQQRRLWEKAADCAPLTLDDFVPESVGPLVEVIHEGRNTLPLPAFLRHFEKRFCRPADAEACLYGYNEGATRPLIGPGFFVTVPTAGTAAWETRGAIVVDYFQVPQGPVVSGWPKVVNNQTGLQVLVYNGTRDFMRRVSDFVTIGAAYKGEDPLDHYFTLVRQPV